MEWPAPSVRRPPLASNKCAAPEPGLAEEGHVCLLVQGVWTAWVLLQLMWRRHFFHGVGLRHRPRFSAVTPEGSLFY